MNDQAATPPATARELLGWLRRQPNSRTMFRRAERLGESYGFGSYILRWTPEQVMAIHHEITAKPARGSSRWGNR